MLIKLLEYYKTLDPEDTAIANALWERLYPAPLTVSRKESMLAFGTFGIRLYQVIIPWQAKHESFLSANCTV